MRKFPGTIKVRIKYNDVNIPDSVVSSLMIGKTPEDTVLKLNALAKECSIPSTYSLATQAEYLAHRAQLVAVAAA